jgi:hypothetical protein
LPRKEAPVWKDIIELGFFILVVASLVIVSVRAVLARQQNQPQDSANDEGQEYSEIPTSDFKELG